MGVVGTAAGGRPLWTFLTLHALQACIIYVTNSHIRSVRHVVQVPTRSVKQALKAAQNAELPSGQKFASTAQQLSVAKPLKKSCLQSSYLVLTFISHVLILQNLDQGKEFEDAAAALQHEATGSVLQ